MGDKKYINYKGVKPATIVTVAEGDGSIGNPYRTTDYVLMFENVQGIQRQITYGKIVPLTEEELDSFNYF